MLSRKKETLSMLLYDTLSITSISWVPKLSTTGKSQKFFPDFLVGGGILSNKTAATKGSWFFGILSYCCWHFRGRKSKSKWVPMDINGAISRGFPTKHLNRWTPRQRHVSFYKLLSPCVQISESKFLAIWAEFYAQLCLMKLTRLAVKSP